MQTAHNASSDLRKSKQITQFEQLRREVKAAWNQACAADGIEPTAKFVVFTNTTEAAAYNELMGMYLRAMKAAR